MSNQLGEDQSFLDALEGYDFSDDPDRRKSELMDLLRAELERCGEGFREAGIDERRRDVADAVSAVTMYLNYLPEQLGINELNPLFEVVKALYDAVNGIASPILKPRTGRPRRNDVTVENACVYMALLRKYKSYNLTQAAKSAQKHLEKGGYKSASKMTTPLWKTVKRWPETVDREYFRELYDEMEEYISMYGPDDGLRCSASDLNGEHYINPEEEIKLDLYLERTSARPVRNDD